jgi:hypothetical protein
MDNLIEVLITTVRRARDAIAEHWRIDGDASRRAARSLSGPAFFSAIAELPVITGVVLRREGAGTIGAIAAVDRTRVAIVAVGVGVTVDGLDDIFSVARIPDVRRRIHLAVRVGE